MNNTKEIKIFKSITTEEAILELEAESKKYDGLYVDMDNPPERKYVKDKAALIAGLLKKLDRARIDESKNYKLMVEAEAADIKLRLEEANKPFTLLIDEHKEKRAKELAIEKKKQQQIELAILKENDHELAIMEDKIRTIERQEAEKARIEHEERLKSEAIAGAEERQRIAVEKAKQDEIDRQARIAEEEKAELERRLADTNHKASVNNAILEALVANGFSVDDSKKFIKLAAKKQLPNLTINY